MVRAGADPVRGHDHPVSRLPQARAVPLPDRRGVAGAVGPAAVARDRRAGQRRLPADQGSRWIELPAHRVLQDRPRHLPGQLPARHSTGDGDGRASGVGGDAAAAQALRPGAGHLGRGHGRARTAVGHRLLAHVLRGAAVDALRRHRATVICGHRAAGVRHRRLVPGHPHPARQRPLRGLAAPVRSPPLPRHGRELPGGQRDLRPVGRRPVRAGVGPVDPVADPVPADRHDLRGHHQRAGPVRRHRRPRRLPAVHLPWLQDRDAGPRLVLDAAGGRAVDGVRAPGVRDRGRGHAGDPPHRRDAAVHLLRRRVDRGQLRAAGAAAARVGPLAETRRP